MTNYETIDALRVGTYNRAIKKQRLINFMEEFDRVDWKFYESKGFFNVFLLCADWYTIKEIIEKLPKDFYFHISAETNRFEIYADAD